MRAYFDDVIDYSAEVLVEIVQKSALLSQIEQQLVVFGVSATHWHIWIEVLLNLVDAVFKSCKGLVAKFSQV